MGLTLGLALALKRREAPCPDGTYFPEGTTDFRCFVHPHALDGSAIAVISVVLGILIGLVGFVARAILDGASPTEQSGN